MMSKSRSMVPARTSIGSAPRSSSPRTGQPITVTPVPIGEILALVKYVVAAALTLCACESRYGTYIKLDGDPNELRFDHVELFWGNDPMTRAFGTPSGTKTGTVYTREYDMPSDEYDLPHNADGSLPTESTYWLPVTEDNRQLGYVGALVFDKNQNRSLVGVGELQDFSVEDGIVAKFDIELEKPPLLGGLDVWGMAPGCFSWTKPRNGALAPTTISVVLPDDADCDGHVANVDCNDTCPPGAPLCNQMDSVCAPTTTSCALACQKSGQTACNPSVCLPPQACEQQCALAPPTIDSRMGCYIDPITGFAQHHLDLYIHKDANLQLCTDTMQFSPYQRPCKNPIIEWFDSSLDKWTYKITERSDGQCEIKMIKPTDSSFVGDHHILISIDPMTTTGARWTFLLGINNVDNTNCDPKFETGTQRGELQGEPFDCP